MTFRFRLNGAAWPNDPAATGGAGSVTLRARGSSGGGFVDIPTVGDSATIALEPAVYDVIVNARGSIESESEFPWVEFDAVLTVCAPGVVEIDIRATRTLVSATLNGGAFPTVGSGELLWVLLDAYTDHSVLLQFGEGEAVARYAYLEPTTYIGDVWVLVGDVLPRGRFRQSTPLIIPGPESGPAAAVIAATSTTISGSVSVDGSGFGGTAQIFFRSFSVPVEVGRYSVEVLDAAYDVYLQVSSSPTVPVGGARLRSSWRPTAGTHDFAVNTVGVSGTLTLNGAAITSVERDAAVVFDTGERSTTIQHRLPLLPGNPGTFAGRVYEGTYIVSVVDGPGGILPPFEVRLADAYTAPSGPVAYDVQAHRARLTATIDGTTPPDAPGLSRGLFWLRRTLPSGVLEWQNLRATSAGALMISTALPDGRWSVYLGNDEASVAIGLGHLGEIDVGPTDVTRTFDASTVTIAGSVLLGGAAFPEPAGGRSRGGLEIVGISRGDIAVTATGLATYSARVFRGIYNVQYRCDGCDLGLGALRGDVLRAIRLE